MLVRKYYVCMFMHFCVDHSAAWCTYQRIYIFEESIVRVVSNMRVTYLLTILHKNKNKTRLRFLERMYICMYVCGEENSISRATVQTTSKILA